MDNCKALDTMSSNDPKLAQKLETFSLMRMLPAGAADMGDVTREELRERDLGAWSAPSGRIDDVRAVQGAVVSSPQDPRTMADFDEVLPLEERDAAADRERVIELSFKAG